MAFDDNIENSYEKNITIQPSMKWFSVITNITNVVLKRTYNNVGNNSNSLSNISTSNSSYISNNNTTFEVPYEEYKYRPETYMVPIMFSIIFIVGVVGNGTLIVVFVRHRAMRNVPNT